MEQVKTCSRCGQEQPLERFARRNNRPDGYQPWCKACHAARMRAWVAQRKERDPGFAHEAVLRRYRLSRADYAALLEAQAGVCAICGRVPTNKQRLCIDHDRRTGHVRGLLCRKCNSALAMADDTVDYLHKLIAYLTAR